MKKLSLPVTLILSGCITPEMLGPEWSVPDPICTTARGLQLYGVRSDCDQLQIAEEHAMIAFDGWGGHRETLEWVLNGTMIVTADEAPITVPNGGGLAHGYAWCELKYIKLEKFDIWQNSAFSHELAHLIECRVLSNWNDQGHHRKWSDDIPYGLNVWELITRATEY